MHTSIVIMKTLVLSLVVSAASLLIAVPTVSAAELVNVTPYQNLSTTAPTLVTVTATGLLPNTDVDIRQVEMNRVPTGVQVEQAGKANVNTGPLGTISTQVSVQYDVRPDLAFADFCQNSNELGRLCYLQLMYMSGESSGEVVTQYKLYFGTSGPVVVPPTQNTPASKDDCKNNDWKNFVDATGNPFKNQGACIKFVNENS